MKKLALLIFVFSLTWIGCNKENNSMLPEEGIQVENTVLDGDITLRNNQQP